MDTNVLLSNIRSRLATPRALDERDLRQELLEIVDVLESLQASVEALTKRKSS